MIVRSSKTLKSVAALALVFCLAIGYSYSLSEKVGYKSVSIGEIEEDKSRDLNKLSTRQKVAQLIFAAYDGQDADQQLLNLVSTEGVGGVMLMPPNLTSETQVASLNKDIQTAAIESSNSKIFIAVDQEGGTVNRISWPGYELSSQRSVADLESASRVASKRASELSKLGFNTNFSPVVEDIQDPSSFLYDRSFSGNVANMSSVYIDEYQSNGILATAKHFPGHENSSIDSHVSLPIVDIDDSTFKSRIGNFSQIIDESEPAFVMMSHVLYLQQDSLYPASLSPTIIKDYLKGSLGHRGLVITDDLTMNSIAKDRTTLEAAVDAYKAGNDMLLIIAEIPEIIDVIDNITFLIESGELTEESLNEKVYRIIDSKQSL